jgi:hypothetical protein
VDDDGVANFDVLGMVSIKQVSKFEWNLLLLSHRRESPRQR